MKTKISRVLGVGLALMLLVSLMAIASPVAADDMEWSTVGVPGTKGKVLLEDSDVSVLAIAPDGLTMFAYDSESNDLYKSTDAGASWTTDGVDTDDVFDGDPDINAIAVSPNYADDSTVIAAASPAAGTDLIYRSTNGGKTWADMNSASLALADATEVITSVAASPYYTGGDAYLCGVRDTDDNAQGDVYLFKSSGFTWASTALNEDALAVAFSPQHTLDAEILALSVDDDDLALLVDDTLLLVDDTLLHTMFGSEAWDATVLAGTIETTEATSGVIAFPADYEWASNNKTLVGIAGSSDDNVYLVTGDMAPATSSTVKNLKVKGDTLDIAIKSVAVKGNFTEAEVLAGLKDADEVRRTSDPSASTVSWSGAKKAPIGATDVIVGWAGDTAYAGTTGYLSAYSTSADGDIWSGNSLIGVGNLIDVVMVDSSIVDADTMYLVLYDDEDDNGMGDAGDYTMVFRTTDGGSGWDMVWWHKSTAGEYIQFVQASPEYGTDSTVFAVETLKRIWKSTSAGDTWLGLTSPANITAFTAVDAGTYYTGHTDKVYKSGRWTSGSVQSGKDVVSIAVAPDDNIYAGTSGGNVYVSTDDAKNFDRLGADTEAGGAAGNTYVALDSGYGSNSMLYAASANGDVNRWTYDDSTSWKSIHTGGNAFTGVASLDDVLYWAENAADQGVNRCTNATAGAGFSVDELDLDFGLVDADNAAFKNVEVIPGSNVVYGIAGLGAGREGTTVGYLYRLFTFTDTITAPLELAGPKPDTVNSGGLDLSWKAPEAGGRDVDYEVWIATDSAFDYVTKYNTAGAQDLEATFVPAATANGTALGAGQQYWWKVRVCLLDDVQYFSDWSSEWSFTVKLNPTDTASTVTSPAPGASGIALKPQFQWTAVGGASSYELELADNPFYANAQVKKPLNHTVWTWDEELEYNTTYYWRVRAVKTGSGITTTYSNWVEGSFTTMGEPAGPAAPPVVIQQTPAPQINIPQAPAPEYITPAYIWAVIIIGALLVIALIVLIVRTRRIP